MARGTKITSSDPPLLTIRTAYPAEPLLTLFDPPIELASRRPGGHLHLDGRINCSAICFAVLARIEIHASLEHEYYSGGKNTRTTTPIHDSKNLGSCFPGNLCRSLQMMIITFRFSPELAEQLASFDVVFSA